jgi:hypothetical protein
MQFRKNKDINCFLRQPIALDKLKPNKEPRAIILVLIENP